MAGPWLPKRCVWIEDYCHEVTHKTDEKSCRAHNYGLFGVFRIAVIVFSWIELGIARRKATLSNVVYFDCQSFIVGVNLSMSLSSESLTPRLPKTAPLSSTNSAWLESGMNAICPWQPSWSFCQVTLGSLVIGLVGHWRGMLTSSVFPRMLTFHFTLWQNDALLSGWWWCLQTRNLGDEQTFESVILCLYLMVYFLIWWITKEC